MQIKQITFTRKLAILFKILKESNELENKKIKAVYTTFSALLFR